MRILITGFLEFGAIADNPAARLACHASGLPAAPGVDIDTLLLPVSFERAPCMLRERILAAERAGAPYDAVVMLGVAAAAAEWRIELAAANRDGVIEDADGFTPAGGPIRSESPPLLEATLPSAALLQALEAAGVPARLSSDAGAFLCNHILFRTLHALGPSSPTKAGFIHVPPDEHTFATPDAARTAMPFQQQANGIAVLIAALAPALRRTESSLEARETP